MLRSFAVIVLVSSHDSRSRESIITGVQVLLCSCGPFLDPHLAEIPVRSGYKFGLFVAGRNVPGFKIFEEQLGVAIVLNGLNELFACGIEPHQLVTLNGRNPYFTASGRDHECMSASAF